MELVGDLVSLVVSLAQEIGIIAGVGALTITLIGHLLSLHAHQNETVYGYVRAARHIRALALATIIISGCAAILIHFQNGTPGTLLAPAFLFKWLLIILLTAFYFIELKVEGVKRDAVEGFEGANWYALFIVHTLAPVVGWMFLISIYAGWLATFGIIWAGFIWLMRGKSTIAPKPAAQKPVPPAPAPKPEPHPAPKPVPPSAPKSAPAPIVPPPPVVVPKPPIAPAPAMQAKIDIHPNHSMLPMIAELDLPAPSKVEVPAPKPIPPPVAAPAIAPKPAATVEIVPEFPKHSVPMSNLEESGLPALHVMPKRPEDIESSRRGPVVKVSSDE